MEISMVIKQIIKLSIAASLALGVTTTHSMKKSIHFFKKRGSFKKFTSFFRNLEPIRIITDNSYCGNFNLERIKQIHRIVVPAAQTDNKPIKFGTTKKIMKQYEKTYNQKRLNELKKKNKKEYTIKEKFAGIQEAEKSFELLVKKTTKKPIKELTPQDTTLIEKTIDKEAKLDEPLKRCIDEFIQELKNKKYPLKFKECAKGNKKECEEATKLTNDVGHTLYWKNHSIKNIYKAAFSAGHPNNFKNEEF